MSIGRTFKEAFKRASARWRSSGSAWGWMQRQVADGMRASESAWRQEGEASSETEPLKGWRKGEAPADTIEKSAQKYPIPFPVLRDKLSRPCQGRLYYIRYAFKMAGRGEDPRTELHRSVVPGEHQGTGRV